MNSFRTGLGYDIHELIENRKLVLGGIKIPFDKGLKGHSDADVLLHAICDALLGAAALGDIGSNFPDTEKKYKDIDSGLLLQMVVNKVKLEGYQISNIDANIIIEKPKLKDFIMSMRLNISRICNIPLHNVSVKAKTNEGLDACGRGEAVAANASVLIYSAV